MTWRVLEDSPDRTEYFMYDEGSDTEITKTVFKGVSEILEANKSIQGNDVGKTPDDDAPGWWHVARIPFFVLEKWRLEEGIDFTNKEHGPAILRKLDDAEYRWLRVNTGQLGRRKKMI